MNKNRNIKLLSRDQVLLIKDIIDSWLYQVSIYNEVQQREGKETSGFLGNRLLALVRKIESELEKKSKTNSTFHDATETGYYFDKEEVTILFTLVESSIYEIFNEPKKLSSRDINHAWTLYQILEDLAIDEVAGDFQVSLQNAKKTINTFNSIISTTTATPAVKKQKVSGQEATVKSLKAEQGKTIETKSSDSEKAISSKPKASIEAYGFKLDFENDEELKSLFEDIRRVNYDFFLRKEEETLVKSKISNDQSLNIETTSDNKHLITSEEKIAEGSSKSKTTEDVKPTPQISSIKTDQIDVNYYCPQCQKNFTIAIDSRIKTEETDPILVSRAVDHHDHITVLYIDNNNIVRRVNVFPKAVIEKPFSNSLKNIFEKMARESRKKE